jgi:hypothetical protein
MLFTTCSVIITFFHCLSDILIEAIPQPRLASLFHFFHTFFIHTASQVKSAKLIQSEQRGDTVTTARGGVQGVGGAAREE